jgi:hypothetical protein
VHGEGHVSTFSNVTQSKHFSWVAAASLARADFSLRAANRRVNQKGFEALRHYAAAAVDSAN